MCVIAKTNGFTEAVALVVGGSASVAIGKSKTNRGCTVVANRTLGRALSHSNTLKPCGALDTGQVVFMTSLSQNQAARVVKSVVRKCGET